MIEYTSERRCILMAKKGQKQTNYDNDLINLILKEYNECKSIKRLSDKYDIPEGTIKNWSFKYNHPDKFLGKGQKKGRKKEKDLTKEDWKERYEIAKKYQEFLKAQREKK